MKAKRPKVEPIQQPTLFQMEKLETAAEAAAEGDNKLKEERAGLRTESARGSRQAGEPFEAQGELKSRPPIAQSGRPRKADPTEEDAGLKRSATRAKEERAGLKPGPYKGSVERPFSAPGIFLGTSSFTAAGWAGTFYPADLKSADRLKYYSTRFQAVEIDSTFYGTPAASTVTGWKEKTPADFVFAVKVPQVITHEKVLVGCEAEFDEFIERMGLLGEKLGPMLLQFPKFDKWAFKSSDEFLARLRVFLKRKTHPFENQTRKDGAPSCRLAIEIRNKDWLDARFTDVLREHNVALALTDTSFMPRPWEMKEKLDLVTADFAYVRWLGDRKGIEERTKTWDKTIVERQSDLTNWVDVFKAVMTNKRVLKIFAFANNHYAGHAPDTVKQFWNLWNGRKG